MSALYPLKKSSKGFEHSVSKLCNPGALSELLFFGVLVLIHLASLEKILDKETGNAARLTFVNELIQWASDLHDKDIVPRLVDEIRPWASSRSEKTLRSLSLPTPDEYAIIARAVAACGGIEFFKDT